MKHGRVFSHCRGTYEYRLTVVKPDSTDFFMYTVETFNVYGQRCHPAYNVPGLCYIDDEHLRCMGQKGIPAYWLEKINYVAQSLRFVDRNECTVEVS